MAVKYVALDLHQASTSISIRDSRGRVIRREVVPTSAARILEAIDSAGGTIHVTFEEGTLSQWIYDQLVSRVARVIVCDPRHNRLLAAGNKSDRIDADKLSDLLRLGALRAVYHERSAVAALRELVRSYNTLVEDSTHVMLRVKAIFRARGIDCSGIAVYHPKNRSRFLAALSDRCARVSSRTLLHATGSSSPGAHTCTTSDARGSEASSGRASAPIDSLHRPSPSSRDRGHHGHP